MAKRIVFILLAVCCLLLPAEAKKKDSYTEKMEQVLGASQTETIQRVQDALATSDMLSQREKDSLQLLLNYVKDQYVSDILPIYEPIIRKHMSEEDLDWLIVYNNADSSRVIADHATAMATAIMGGDSTVMGYFTSVIKGMEAIMMDSVPAEIIDTTVTNEYEEAFHQYFKASGAGELIGQVFDNILPAIGSALDTLPDMKGRFERAMDYVAGQIEPLTLMLSQNSLTENDLNYATRNMNSSAYLNWKEVQAEVLEDPLALATAFREGFSKYMKKHRN